MLQGIYVHCMIFPKTCLIFHHRFAEDLVTTIGTLQTYEGKGLINIPCQQETYHLADLFLVQRFGKKP